MTKLANDDVRNGLAGLWVESQTFVTNEENENWNAVKCSDDDDDDIDIDNDNEDDDELHIRFK